MSERRIQENAIALYDNINRILAENAMLREHLKKILPIARTHKCCFHDDGDDEDVECLTKYIDAAQQALEEEK